MTQNRLKSRAKEVDLDPKNGDEYIFDAFTIILIA